MEITVKLTWNNSDEKDLFLADLASICDNPLAGHLMYLNPATGTLRAKSISYPAGQVPLNCMEKVIKLPGLENGPEEVVITGKDVTEEVILICKKGAEK